MDESINAQIASSGAIGIVKKVDANLIESNFNKKGYN